MTDEQIDAFTAQAAATTPLGRVGTPDEIERIPRPEHEGSGSDCAPARISSHSHVDPHLTGKGIRDVAPLH
jgi:hypothetical protein